MDTAQTNLFYRISQYRFMCVELNLYLDTHPNDENARADYQCSISASPQRKWAAM